MQLLMCPPDYYGIEYEINPWMNRSRRSDLQLANEQWNALRRVLQERCSIDIHVIHEEPGLLDMVFTANAGLVWHQKSIVSSFRHDVRRREAFRFGGWFRYLGVVIVLS